MATSMQTSHDIVGCLHVVFDDQDAHEGRTDQANPRSSSGASGLIIREIGEARRGWTRKSVTEEAAQAARKPAAVFAFYSSPFELASLWPRARCLIAASPSPSVKPVYSTGTTRVSSETGERPSAPNVEL